ncbi:hypothetical protein OK016_28845 [Vibrio chagasii]|nr:hypothetical protein [Vibrio chagasii]
MVPALRSQRSWLHEERTRACKAAGVTATLVFTVDMLRTGGTTRGHASEQSRPNAAVRRVFQSMRHPSWAVDVGLLGKPHDLGNISTYRGSPHQAEDYIGWLVTTSIRRFHGRPRVDS